MTAGKKRREERRESSEEAAVWRELARAYPFPDPRSVDPEGLVAYGGDLGPERLLSAYSQGVFPWYSEDPILWFSPDPRMVLCPRDLYVGKSLSKRLRARPYRLTLDTDFRAVIEACAQVPRPGQDGTWITADMIEAYVDLHRLGFAHSVEAWEGEDLVGGLYGISLGRAFFGESMFAQKKDASKIAFVTFVQQLEAWGFDLIDCQVETEHLTRFGAENWSRARFLDALTLSLKAQTRRGAWHFENR